MNLCDGLATIYNYTSDGSDYSKNRLYIESDYEASLRASKAYSYADLTLLANGTTEKATMQVMHHNTSYVLHSDIILTSNTIDIRRYTEYEPGSKANLSRILLDENGVSITGTLSLVNDVGITDKLIGVCQEVTQGSLSPTLGATVTKTIGYKSGRTKVLIEMWTTGPSGYYNSDCKNISSSMTAVNAKPLTSINGSSGRYSISNKGVITLYNITSASATSAGEVYYRVTHFN